MKLSFLWLNFCVAGLSWVLYIMCHKNRTVSEELLNYLIVAAKIK